MSICSRIFAACSLVLLTSAGAFGASVFPGVVRTSAGEADFTIELTPEEYAAVKAEPRAILYVARNDRRLSSGKGGAGRGWQKCKYHMEGQTIKLRLPVKDEIQRTLIMYVPPVEKKRGVKGTTIFTAAFYPVDDDLFRRFPLKGDFHSHSSESDGKYDPETVGAHGRKAGLDFLALTDHYQLAPSVTLLKNFERFSLSSYLLLPGEEFHSKPTVLHSVAIGHSRGVNDWSNAHVEEFEQEVKAAGKIFEDQGLNKFELYATACAEVLYNKAREFGARLVIFSHPYNRPGHRFNAPPAHVDALLKRRNFDAIELGYGLQNRTVFTTLAKLRDEAREGRFYPVVGVSDAHDTSTRLGYSCTIAFAPTPDLDGIADAEKNDFSVVGRLAEKDGAIFLGNFRLVNFAYFLHEFYFPRHDEICRRQGETILKWLETREAEKLRDTKQELEKQQQELNEYQQKFWAH